jgi:hypothetical protein
MYCFIIARRRRASRVCRPVCVSYKAAGQRPFAEINRPSSECWRRRPDRRRNRTTRHKTKALFRGRRRRPAERRRLALCSHRPVVFSHNSKVAAVVVVGAAVDWLAGTLRRSASDRPTCLSGALVCCCCSCCYHYLSLSVAGEKIHFFCRPAAQLELSVLSWALMGSCVCVCVCMRERRSTKQKSLLSGASAARSSAPMGVGRAWFH